MWLVKFTERAVINGYNILLRGEMKNLTDNIDDTKDKVVTVMLNILNKRAYN